MLLNEYPHINDPPKQVPCNYVECVSVFGADAGGRKGKEGVLRRYGPWGLWVLSGTRD